MSYQVLARKWRPAKFEQMVGQSHVLMALTNALSQQRLHHAYLFTGTRGVGKTSLARLFAKGLNCETGVTATPCGECSSCIEIAQGRFVDLIEVDAASRTKVDDTRELLDNVQYRPSRGRFKVYLIDEVHMLSRSSFNALLKTLEEPPEHVKFLLATTDPHKLPVTVLSRCLQFNLKSLSQDEISKQLEYVITQEKLPFELQALSLLAKAANGSMRDALSLTDQAIAFGSGQVMLTQVQTMLGSIDEQHVLALLKALCDADVGPLMQTVAKVLAFGADAEEVLRSLLELLHQITLTQFAPAAAQQSLFSEQILAFAQQLAPEQVQLYYQMLLNGRKDLPFAPDPKSGLEMALLRAVAFTPEKQVKRWVTTTPANIDLSVIDHSSTSAQEVIETGPKPDVLPQTHNDLTIAVPAIQAEELPTPEVEDIDVLDDIAVEPSLVAEQALLLDQAQSLGFNSLPPKSVDVQSDQLINDDVDKAAEADVVSATSSDDVVHNADTEATVESNTENLANDITESEEVAEQPTLVPSKADTNTVENSQSSDSADKSSLDAYSFMDYDEADDPSMEYQPSDHDEYVAFSVSNEITEANNVTEASESMSEPKTVNHLVDNNSDLMSDNARQNLTSADDNLDDFLDEVLASRDSLIADVGVLQQQEELAKKESTKTISSRVSKAAAASTSTTAANESSDKSEQAEFSAPTANEASSVTLNGIDKSKVVADYDRPPWVAPKEGEIVNAFADINQETKPAVEATFQPSSSVSQQAGHQHQKPASAQITRSLAADPQNINAEPVIQSNVLAKFEPHSIQGDEVDLHWYKIMTNVSVGGRVRQLGVNSVCPTLSNPIVLVLKPDQKHLSAQTAIDQLQVALSEYLERPTEVEIQIGVVQKRETPLELRKRFHRELIAQAQQSILLDDNVQWMIQHLSAQLDSDTIEYPSEQLGQIAQDIALISAS
ncbi:DNA polymerase III subunit gamma/tau [Shewanella sp. Arc9-LZ]|jgi:DNA polymerase-3 subunit gamma/tau|uniref:DNA polymerase III subunit gamma/tau n=1 Tax=Shewanella sp. Arc9-LZ TaxID=2698686 RepID=UPI00137BE757|nr:DNA polymerase III subunit gamma/tau [Shewanella sp. Arc9-LZ]QHS13069.1 DNA polymerase III subunit gamma/tau [Shewanella sp. Arc9-LZ]